MNKAEALAYRRKIETAAEQQSDELALQSIELFQPWSDRIGVETPVGKRVQDGGRLWECIQLHTPQADWHPADTPALWKEVSLDEWPEIPENIPAESPWMAGDKGTWKGQHYICKIDNCVWNPDVYPAAWELQP